MCQIMSQEEPSAFAPGVHIKERRLEGKVAVITGGATGIGEVTARLFLRHGAKVIIADVADDTGSNLCKALGPSATYIHCDISRDKDMGAAVDMAVNMYGSLDIMYNNAGIMDRTSGNRAAQYDMDEFDRIMRVNIRGTMLGIKHAARVMIPRKEGSIVCTASIAGIMGGLASYAYTASKHAIVGLMKNAAAELGKHGIRVNCVSPSGVATAMSVGLFKSPQSEEEGKALVITEEDRLKMEGFANSIANLKGATLKAEDVAEGGLYLASDDARYVSGHNLVVDGGFTVVNHS